MYFLNPQNPLVQKKQNKVLRYIIAGIHYPLNHMDITPPFKQQPTNNEQEKATKTTQKLRTQKAKRNITLKEW
jgi:hypothetical protein